MLQQEDTARGLYENPVNLFAADFLGTPPINQLHGVVQNGRLVLDGGIPAALALPDGLAEGQEIVLAVRAESILPQSDTPAFRTTVLERYSACRPVPPSFAVLSRPSWRSCPAQSWPSA